MNDFNEQPFNYRSFRGTKIIRLIEHLEVAKSTLSELLEFNKEIDSKLGVKSLEGRLKGLSNAIEVLKNEFEIVES